MPPAGAELAACFGATRAEAVRADITAAGIQASRVEIVSLGEDRPGGRGRNEAAWSRNRRAETVVTAGAFTASR